MIFKAGDRTNSEFPCEIIKRLPGGTMAEIYVARLANTSHLVAVKGVSENAPQSRKDALKKETEIMQKIRLDIIPEFYGYFEEPGRRYIVMSYHSGQNLEMLAEKEPLCEGQAKEIALGLCRTLAYLHKKGIVYGDLKPSNILFDSQTEQAVLLDYGAAIWEAEDLQNIYFRGTAGYAAPECFEKIRRSVTCLVDVFALGATLYRLLEGQDPQVHYGRFYLSDTQKKNRWQSVLDKCCALESKNRYQSMAQIYDAINKINI